MRKVQEEMLRKVSYDTESYKLQANSNDLAISNL